MNRNDSIKELLLAVSLWVLSARKEEVIVVRPNERLGELKVLDFQLGVRAGGKSGAHVFNEWAILNQKMLEKSFVEAKGYSPDTSVDALEHWCVTHHVQPLELASKLSESQMDGQCDALSSIFCGRNPRNLDDEGTKEMDAWLPIRAPQSNTALRLFYRGVPSVMHRIVSGLCGNMVDVVQYFLSALNAKVAAFMRGSADGKWSGKFVIADLRKPLYVDADGCRHFASTAGGDGNMPFTWSSPERNDLQGQIRGFALNLEKEFGIILKGVAVGSDIWLTPEGTLTDTWYEGCEDVVVADLNMVKGRGKETDQHIAAKHDTSDLAIPQEVNEQLFMWLIRVVKSAEEHRGTLKASFQETGFHRAAYTRVDENQLFNGVRDRVCRVSDEKKAFTDECLNLVGVDLQDFCLPNGEVPYAAVLESVNHVIERAASSGTFREGQSLKVWGNQLTPCGVVLMSHKQTQYTRQEDIARADGLKAKLHGDFFESGYWALGFAEFGRLVAHRRTPQLTPWCLSTSRAVSHQDLNSLVVALRTGEHVWTTAEGFELDVWNTVHHLREVHNARVMDKGYNLDPKAVWGQLYADDVDGQKLFAVRLIEWAISLDSSNIESFFVAQPLDGRDRNEDHDGDDSMACPSRFWVDKYAKIEAYWRRLKLFVNEMPKERALNYRKEQLNQLLPDPNGKLESVVNIKGATLDELFPDVSYCTPARLKAISKVTLSDPQGPTGLGSNVAADLFARVEFVDDPQGRVNWRGEILLVPSEATEKVYHLWVLYCLFVQVFIDWQKRAYELFQLIHWRKVVRRVLAAGSRGVQSFDGMLDESEMATLDTEWMGEKELATNWCYSPSVIYALAEEELDIQVCLWKWKRGQASWKASSDEIMEDADAMAHSRFRSVLIAMHKVDGVLDQFGDAKDYVEKIASTVKSQTSPKKELVDRVPQAFLYIESETLKAGEDGDLEKVGANYRGGLFLRGLGFDRDAQESLLSGGNAKSSLIEGDFTYQDLLIAGAHGSEGREVDAFEILVSFFVSQKEVSDEAKELMAFGEERRDDFLRGLVYVTSPEKKFSPVPKGQAFDMPARSMYPDLLELWENAFELADEYLEGILPDICAKAYDAGSDDRERLALAKMSASRMLAVLHTCRIQCLRTETYSLGIKTGSHKQPIGLSFDAYQDELEFNPNATLKHSMVQKGENGLYVRKGKKANHLRNWCNSHYWLPAVNHDCPVRMAFESVLSGRPFLPQPDSARAFSLAEALWNSDESLIIKCRTLTGAGGYMTANTIDEAIDIVFGDSSFNEEGYADIFGALSFLRGCSSDRIGRDQEEIVRKGQKEFKTSEFYRQELLAGRSGMMPLSHGVSDWLSEEFGLTPIPKSLTFIKDDEELKGEKALARMLELLLLFVCVEKHIQLTDKVTDVAYAKYQEAKEDFVDLIRKHDLPIDPAAAKSLYWFTPMAVSKDSPLSDKIARFKRLKTLAVVYQDLGT